MASIGTRNIKQQPYNDQTTSNTATIALTYQDAAIYLCRTARDCDCAIQPCAAKPLWASICRDSDDVPSMISSSSDKVTKQLAQLRLGTLEYFEDSLVSIDNVYEPWAANRMRSLPSSSSAVRSSEMPVTDTSTHAKYAARRCSNQTCNK